jgi:TRAP-type transport system small permease protein
MLDRTIRSITAASAILLLGVTLLVFVSVLLRFLFSAPIPDTNDIGRLTLGIALMNGIALATYYGQQITMDTLWLAAGAKIKRLLDLLSTTLTTAALMAMAWMMVARVDAVIASHEQTFDLGLPLWLFYGLTAASAVGAALLCLARLWMLWRGEVIAAPSTGEYEA